ncbi:MAG: hypothetical protein A3J65_00365 [Candidatus Buchananbacteria bacterium RIFCSPHIGHO2_02_FULL_45_11b]|uniref:Uncharacterized protein n=4 Tax=Candidatus Buchananiibacteriota TaxID=1817903 RepID=A0A1G1YMR1_9BACT|nr:MAG: hypothetical protein A2663_01030 [Candidatus Buchananbacteria bacterium RIFCSPHIGHO2_01_FULL_46_12]OGY50927.1 MAG: hypothetical protein A3J65_00365 [Candidatus Buchananbacteria bacterium RIFCSPHIGHO2_02_FULL_45_11b]OGY53589.1 MAG: hypothetical protein A3B15_03385 [Candidatus Buchananbacteria bacterium RIFCSPLOWO2_01_FULL_45_31]OGY57344.1 MAG: hypothetical protein A3H67_04365 [Candidatus Buchananbacteria bacterium RIFCSPLOWO2_02_FULL_46_11b]
MECPNILELPVKEIRALRAWPQTAEELAYRQECQRREMASELNRHGTREEFGLRPEEEDHEKYLRHYVHCNRIAEIGMQFDLAHTHLNVWSASQTLGFDIRCLPVCQREAVLLAVWSFWQEIAEKSAEK